MTNRNYGQLATTMDNRMATANNVQDDKNLLSTPRQKQNQEVTETRQSIPT